MLNSIMQAFYHTSEDIISILERLHDPNQFFEKTFLRILSVNYLKDIKPEILTLIDAAIVQGHENAELYSLFLIKVWGLFSGNARADDSFTNKSLTILSILKNTVTENMHSFLHATMTQIDAFYERQLGNFEESYSLLLKSLALLPKEHPRFSILVSNFYTLLCTEGRLAAIPEAYLNRFESELVSTKSNLLIINYLENSIFTGQIERGLYYIELFRGNHADKDVGFLDGYENLFLLLNNPSVKVTHNNTFDVLLQTVILLMKEGKALEAQQQYEKLLVLAKKDSTLFIIDHYFFVHFELLKGNIGNALLALVDLQKSKGHQYFDDFFYGRIYLLQKKFEEADDAFGKLLENVKKYDAFGRLAFEVQFAKELDLLFSIRLMEGKVIKHQIFKAEIEYFVPDFSIVEKENDLLLGGSSSILAVKELVKKYAAINATILITGETGTGKELTAQSIHLEGKYKEQPFLAINCSALTDNLLQSELFGYVAGAFTGAQKAKQGIFEAAGNGTVFLDEFGEVSPKLQVSLLRVLEANEIRPLGSNTTIKIHCKIIVATNKDLKKAVLEKTFREDLFFRLTRFEIKLPPLRTRREDIPILVNRFLENSNSYNKENKEVSLELMEAMMRYDWPGNIRELKNEVDRLYVLSFGVSIIPLALSDLLKEFRQKLVTNSEISDNKSEDKQVSFLTETQRNLIENMGFKADIRFETIKELFKKYEKLSRNQIMTITKVSPATATKDLVILSEQGFIRKVMPTKSPRTHYFEIIK